MRIALLTDSFTTGGGLAYLHQIATGLTSLGEPLKNLTQVPLEGADDGISLDECDFHDVFPGKTNEATTA